MSACPEPAEPGDEVAAAALQQASGDAAIWATLRRHTPSRIGLGRTGSSLPTAAALSFALAHAQARDAVYAEFDVPALVAEIEAMGHAVAVVQSAAADRTAYLHRPDLGRRLPAEAAERLAATRRPSARERCKVVSDVGSDVGNDGAGSLHHVGNDASRGATDGCPSTDVDDTIEPADAVFVIGDGLSARAAVHAVDVLRALLPLLDGWRFAPVVVVLQARVAIGDAIAAAVGARQVVMAIGERPGLSSPDSLGLYLTQAPKPGKTTDAERNCISNVRPQGQPCATAAARLAWLMREARRLQLTGVGLKDESTLHRLETAG